jgi:hypothetical protein
MHFLWRLHLFLNAIAMKTEIYLQIPKPCHENWDAMTTVDKGKFCSSCSKEVIDFSLLTDAEVLNYFKKSTGNTCGRFTNDQLQRPLQETRIEKKKGWKWLLASITSLIMISRTQAQKREISREFFRKVKIEQSGKSLLKGYIETNTTKHPIIKPISATKKPLEDIVLGSYSIAPIRGNVKIQGNVVDENNNPIAGVIIYTGKNNILGFTNSKGHFEVSTDTKETRLSFSCRAFGFMDESAIIDLPVTQSSIKITMQPHYQELQPVTVVSYASRNCTATMGKVLPYQQVSKKDTVIAFIRKALDTVKIVENTFKIYPNPAIKNSAVHITVKEPGKYQIQLFDNMSRLLHTDENTTTSKKQNISFQLPGNMASGYYYIRLINQQTKKALVDKLIVQ